MNVRLIALLALGTALTLGLLVPPPAAGQGPLPTPSVPPAPGQPLTPNSVPAVGGKRFPTNRFQLLAGLLDANQNVDSITAANVVDLGQSNTVDPFQVQHMIRRMSYRPRIAALASQLTQALRQRGLLSNQQVVLAVVQDRVYVVTLPAH
jgi:hypothetical protein